MHELLLYGQVPRARHEQVLKVLAGVAAMQPRRVIKRHIVYKPTRAPEEPGANLKRGATQAVAVKATKHTGAKDLYYVQLVQQLSEQDFDPATDQQATESSLASQGGPGWTLEFNHVPDAGDRGGVLVRLTNSTDIVGGDPNAYMVNLKHQFVSEYYVEGSRFVHENVVIFLHRILHEPGVRSLETSPKTVLPNFSALQPLDPSGAYILEAKIRVQDLNNTVVSEAGVEELNRFKNQMKGCVELAAPERLLLDTRVKYKPNAIAATQARLSQAIAR